MGGRLAERLDVVKLAPATILDAGCGTGDALGELAARYPRSRVVALDAAWPMVDAARTRSLRGRTLLTRLLAPLGRAAQASPAFICADATALPLRAASVELVWSNLMLQWVDDPPRAFAEFRRVLAVGGLLTFTTFGPDTLKELARAFAAVDGYTHVSRFIDMHDLGDLLVHAGFADPVIDMEMITVTYPTSRRAARRAQGDRRDQPDARPAARPHRPASPAGARRRSFRARPRRPRSGDVRGGLRPCVEGRAAAHGGGVADREGGAAAVGAPGPSPMTQGLFVTGTDTGIGKTVAAVALLRAFAASGRRAVGMKPIAAGIEAGTGVNADVAALDAAGNVAAPLADRNPYAFAPAIAPHVAAAQAGVTIDLAAIEAAYRRLAARADAVVVEGAGGPLVPLGPRGDMLDIAKRLALPVVLVVGVRLGCLHHALAAELAIRSRGLELAGWIANRIDPRCRPPTRAWRRSSSACPRRSSRTSRGARRRCRSARLPRCGRPERRRSGPDPPRRFPTLTTKGSGPDPC